MTEDNSSRNAGSGNTGAEAQRRAIALAHKLAQNPRGVQGFGVDAQRAFATMTRTLVDIVRASTGDRVVERLNELLQAVSSVDLGKMQKRTSLFGRIFGNRDPITEFEDEFTTTSVRVSSIANDVDGCRIALSRDLIVLDRLSISGTNCGNDISLYIRAAEISLSEVDAIIERVTAEVQQGPGIPEQRLADWRSGKAAIEQRLLDLRTAHVACLQTHAQIQVIRATQQSLIDKIHASVLTVIPLWQQEIAGAISAAKQAAIAKQDVLRQQGSSGAQAGQRLVTSLREAIAISDDARQQRVTAVGEVIKKEQSSAMP